MGRRIKLEIVLTEEDIAIMEKPNTLGKMTFSQVNPTKVGGIMRF